MGNGLKRLLFFFFVLGGSSATIMAQHISGTVIDTGFDEPLMGATVVIKGQPGGTATDIDGNFTIETSLKSGTISVSFMGFTTKEVPFRAGEKLTIHLSEDNAKLEEVVVIGYGAQKRSDLTGSVVSVNAGDLANTPTTNIVQALQGKAAGVEINQNSGAPGAIASIRIRGMGTVNDSDPLYVVDGMPIDDISYLASEEIANIEILKDAASAAIYGSRAANGVVLITTKDGGNGKKKVNILLHASYGMSDVYKAPEIMSVKQYTKYRDYVQNSYNYTTTDAQGKLSFTDDALAEIAEGNDWWNLSTHNGEQSKVGLALSGGDKSLNYYLSANVLDTKGIIRHSGYQRLSVNSKVNANLSDALRINSSLTYSNEDRDVVSEGNRGIVKSAITYSPLEPIQDMSGTYTYYTPIENFRRLNYDKNSTTFSGQMKFEWDIVKSLMFTSRASYTKNTSDVDRMQRSRSSELRVSENSYTVIKNPISSHNFSWDNTFTWKPKLGGFHNFSAVVGQTMEMNKYQTIYSSGKGYGGYDNEFNSLTFATYDQATTSYQYGYTALGFLGRISYSWHDRYLLQTNFRADGSSRFSKSNRWGFFPSVSAGWRVSEEDWLKDFEDISQLKLRIGWGQLGNNRIENLSRLTLLSYNNEDYIYGVGTPIVKPGYAITQFGNEDLVWERTESTNMALDFGFFDSRLSGSIEYFIKDTKDMLLEVPIVYSSGWVNNPYQNTGSVNNKGFEAQVKWSDRINDFGYEISGNFSKVKNVVTSLGKHDEPVQGGNLSSPNNLGYVTRTIVGGPIGTFYGYKVAGIMQPEDFGADGRPLIPVKESSYAYTPGDRKYVDINGDGQIDENDKTIIGNPHPDFYYAFNLGFSYKNWSVEASFQGVYGNDIFNASKYFLYSNVTYNGSWSSNFDYSNVATDYFDRVYRPEGKNDYRTVNYGSNTKGDVPAPTTVSSRSVDNFAASDWYVEDGSYLRLKQIQINYTFPQTVTKKMCVQSIKAYGTVANLFTFTKYSGLDPEVGKTIGDEANTGIGIDQGTYPQSRTYMIGVIIDY